MCFTMLHNLKLYTEAPSRAMTLERHPTRLHLSQEQLGFPAAQPAQSVPPDVVRSHSISQPSEGLGQSGKAVI